jgi:hypothetical protein
MAAPLHDLTQHDKIKTSEHWNESCTTAFEAIKTAMTSAPVLALPDITKPFVVYTDASEIAIGAVLLQQGEDQALRPVCYLSRKHPDVVTRYAVWEQELFALVTALKEWRCYLEGTTSTVYTDHKSLTTLMTQKKLNSRQANWLEEIWCYHHNIVYQRGETNLADPFSRRPDHEPADILLAPIILAQNGVNDMTLDLIKHAYAVDPYYMDPKHSRVTRLHHENGLYYYASRLCIPDDTHIRTLLLNEAHLGHQDIARTLANLSRFAYWPLLSRDVKTFVNACRTCKSTSAANIIPQDIVPPQPWDSISMDFMTRLPRTTKGFDGIAVFVEAETQYVRIVPINKANNGTQFATVFHDTIFDTTAYQSHSFLTKT